MRRVMLDPVHAAADVRFVQAGGTRHLAGNSADASQVPRAVGDERPAGRFRSTYHAFRNR